MKRIKPHDLQDDGPIKLYEFTPNVSFMLGKHSRNLCANSNLRNKCKFYRPLFQWIQRKYSGNHFIVCRYSGENETFFGIDFVSLYELLGSCFLEVGMRHL